MKREDLEKLGLSKEQIDAVMAENGKDVEAQKAKITAAQGETDALKKQIEDANKQIEGFKGMDIEGVKKTADEYKSKFETAQAESAKQMAALKFDHSLEGALNGAKVKYSKEVLARLKLDELKDKDGNFIPERFESQIKTVKESASDLFTDDTPTPRIVTGGNNQSVITDAVVAAARQGAGLQPAK